MDIALAHSLKCTFLSPNSFNIAPRRTQPAISPIKHFQQFMNGLRGPIRVCIYTKSILSSIFWCMACLFSRYYTRKYQFLQQIYLSTTWPYVFILYFYIIYFFLSLFCILFGFIYHFDSLALLMCSLFIHHNGCDEMNGIIYVTFEIEMNQSKCQTSIYIDCICCVRHVLEVNLNVINVFVVVVVWFHFVQ